MSDTPSPGSPRGSPVPVPGSPPSSQPREGSGAAPTCAAHTAKEDGTPSGSQLDPAAPLTPLLSVLSAQVPWASPSDIPPPQLSALPVLHSLPEPPGPFTYRCREGTNGQTAPRGGASARSNGRAAARAGTSRRRPIGARRRVRWCGARGARVPRRVFRACSVRV